MGVIFLTAAVAAGAAAICRAVAKDVRRCETWPDDDCDDDASENELGEAVSREWGI